MNWPEVSIIIPTLNSERTLGICLESISRLSYKGKIEVIVADGGSKDTSLTIAKKFRARIVTNLLKTAESGKAVGFKHSNGEVIAFIDSDNVITDRLWIEKMVSPLMSDKEIIASEPLYFTYRKKDHWLTRYFSLIGMGDPLNLFLGNYDRFSFITNRWTGLNINYKNEKDYYKVTLKKEIPTIGANGFLIRRSVLKKYKIKDYLFDVDVIRYLANIEPVIIAKVKIGIVHLFVGNISTYIRKIRRKLRDYLYFNEQGIRSDVQGLDLYFGVAKFTLATIFIIPLIVQAVTGYLRKKDLAWFFHPLACWITLITYTLEFTSFLVFKGNFSRDKWGQ